MVGETPTNSWFGSSSMIFALGGRGGNTQAGSTDGFFALGGESGVGDGDDQYCKVKVAGSAGGNGVYMRLRDTMWSGQGGASAYSSGNTVRADAFGVDPIVTNGTHGSKIGGGGGGALVFKAVGIADATGGNGANGYLLVTAYT